MIRSEGVVPHSCQPGYTMERYPAQLVPGGETVTCVRRVDEHHAIGSVYECDECGRLWRCEANEILAHGFCELRDLWRPMGRFASRRFRRRARVSPPGEDAKQ